MASEAGAAIATVGLGFSYDRLRVLHNVDIRAEPGQVVGLLGPNGSGKSTLIKILSAVLEGYEGSAQVGGSEVGRLPRRELARRVAVVPQEPSFSFPFTALEVVLMGRHPHLAGLAFESDRALHRFPRNSIKFPDPHAREVAALDHRSDRCRVDAAPLGDFGNC